MTKYFFTPDGTYGEADGLVMFDTAKWTDAQWAFVRDCTDGERLNRAMAANAYKHTTKRNGKVNK